MDFTRITELIKAIPSDQMPGIDVLIFHHGREVYRHSQGTCDYMKQTPVSDDTLYWIYSMTKPITMTAVMQCAQRGLLDLEAPVSRYLPAFANMTVRHKDGTLTPAKREIKVHNLLSMTSGMSYEFYTPDRLDALRNANVTTQSFVDVLAKEPLHFEPGDEFEYSFSHDVAARIVEVVSGMKFGEFVQKNIFDPLGMKSATFHLTEEMRPRMAAQFRRRDSKGTLEMSHFRNDFIVSDKYESGGAGLICSAADYGKFVAAMSTAFSSENPLLSKASIDKMRSPQLTEEMSEKAYSKHCLGYNYGLGVRTMLHPERVGAKSPIGEFGWDGAAGSTMLLDPDNEIGLVYMTQVFGSNYSYFEFFPKLRDLTYEIILNK